MKNKIIAFDLGGSSIKYTINLLQSFETIEIKNINKEKVIEFISNIANKEIADEICISSPGIINSKNGYVSGLSAINDWYDFNIFKELLKHLNNKKTKIYIENDGNCSLLGNIKKENKKINSSLSIVIGTGVGGSLYLNGKIIKGKNNLAGELGMMKYINDDKKTISSELSTNALCQKIKNKLKIELNGIEIFNQFNKNKNINKIVKKWIYGHSIFLFNMIWTFDPEYIFIGGAVSNNKIFKKIVIQYLNNLFKKIHSSLSTKIVFSENGNEANLLGALLQSKNYTNGI